MNKKRRRGRRGQGLVEFALIIMLLIGTIAMVIDVFPMVGDWFVAKEMSARGTRAASIYLPDGSRTCLGDVLNAIGNPSLPFADWTVTVSENCTSNPFATIPPRTLVSVTINVDYHPPFWGGFGYPPKETASVWPFSQETIDQAR